MFIYGQKEELKEELGFWQLFLMSFSGTLGAGFFVLLGTGASIAGSLLPLSFLGAGIAAFLVSRVFAELATSMPAPGGGQVYTRTAFGESPALFVVHLLTWLAELSFTALNALGLGIYLSVLVPLPPIVITITGIIVLTIINLRGVGNIGKVEVVIGAGLLLSILGIIYLSFNSFDWSELKLRSILAESPALGWFYAIPLVSVVFIGNEDVAAIASEIKNKEKNIPRVLTLTVVALTLITAVLSFFLLYSLPVEKISKDQHAFSILSERFGRTGKALGLGVAIFSCVSSLFYGSLADTRTAYALAKAGEFPNFLSRVNKNKVPYASVLTSGILVSFLVISENVSTIAYVANLGLFLECIAVSLALIKLRKKRGFLPRPYLVKPYPLIPILVIVLCGLLLLFVKPISWGIAILFSLAGLPIYLLKFLTAKKFKIALAGAVIFTFLALLIFLFLQLH